MSDDPGNAKYSVDDSQTDTGATDREQSEAWHAARQDFRNTYGSLDPQNNQSGYNQAFGPVAGQNEAR